jgi:4-hydroxy-L-threonine phosphate dehydrogenase PdxA
MQPRVGITLGDCAGIGPEIVDLALKSGRLPDSAEYKIIGKYPDCSLGNRRLRPRAPQRRLLKKP